MPKRRSIGVALWGWYFIIAAVVGLLVDLHLLLTASAPGPGSFKLAFTLLLILCVFNFFVGLNLLRLKELWRKIALGYSVFVVICCLVSLRFPEARSGEEVAVLAFVAFICVSLFFFFTRRGVKEQFSRSYKTH